MHSFLLASCCPLLAEVLQPLHDSVSDDIMTVIIPDIREAVVISNTVRPVSFFFLNQDLNKNKCKYCKLYVSSFDNISFFGRYD